MRYNNPYNNPTQDNNTMKTKHSLLSLLATVLVVTGLVTSCGEDDPKDLAIVSILAGTIDLNGATAPTDVPVNPSIVITFTTNVDPLTANNTNVTLTQDYDQANIPLTVTASGKTVTIAPTNPLSGGALYRITIKAGLQSDEKQPLAEASRTFTTAGTFTPAGVVAHWTFEDNANDVVGPYDPVTANIIDITYAASRNTKGGKAASFNGSTSIIEVRDAAALINSNNFTISFWMKTNSTGKDNGHFVMGMGAFYGLQYEVFGNYEGAKFAFRYNLADNTTASEDMWLPAGATDNTTGGWQGWDFAKNVTAPNMIAMLKDNWLHVTYTYNATSRQGILYYNGEKMKSFDFDLWPDGDAKRGVTGLKWGGAAPDVYPDLAFGFIQSRRGEMWANESWGGYQFPTSNHFKGLLDDVKIYHKVLTPTEISLMYNSEK
jgi:hypothetical protein